MSFGLLCRILARDGASIGFCSTSLTVNFGASTGLGCYFKWFTRDVRRSRLALFGFAELVEVSYGL